MHAYLNSFHYLGQDPKIIWFLFSVSSSTFLKWFSSSSDSSFQVEAWVWYEKASYLLCNGVILRPLNTFSTSLWALSTWKTLVIGYINSTKLHVCLTNFKTSHWIEWLLRSSAFLDSVYPKPISTLKFNVKKNLLFIFWHNV